jgi:hypothetical protein
MEQKKDEGGHTASSWLVRRPTCIAELGLRFTPTAVRCAVRSCSLTKVIWLHEEQHCELSEGLLAAAAEAGSVDIMQWLVEKHVALNPLTTAT